MCNTFHSYHILFSEGRKFIDLYLDYFIMVNVPFLFLINDTNFNVFLFYSIEQPHCCHYFMLSSIFLVVELPLVWRGITLSLFSYYYYYYYSLNYVGIILGVTCTSISKISKRALFYLLIGTGFFSLQKQILSIQWSGIEKCFMARLFHAWKRQILIISKERIVFYILLKTFWKNIPSMLMFCSFSDWLSVDTPNPFLFLMKPATFLHSIKGQIPLENVHYTLLTLEEARAMLYYYDCWGLTAPGPECFGLLSKAN